MNFSRSSRRNVFYKMCISARLRFLLTTRRESGLELLLFSQSELNPCNHQLSMSITFSLLPQRFHSFLRICFNIRNNFPAAFLKQRYWARKLDFGHTDHVWGKWIKLPIGICFEIGAPSKSLYRMVFSIIIALAAGNWHGFNLISVPGGTGVGGWAACGSQLRSLRVCCLFGSLTHSMIIQSFASD